MLKLVSPIKVYCRYCLIIVLSYLAKKYSRLNHGHLRHWNIVTNSTTLWKVTALIMEPFSPHNRHNVTLKTSPTIEDEMFIATYFLNSLKPLRILISSVFRVNKKMVQPKTMKTYPYSSDSITLRLRRL